MTGAPPSAAAAPRRGWPLRRRLTATVAVVLVVLAVLGAAVGVALAALDRAVVDVADRYGPARVEGARLLAALVDEETAVRGYALSRRAVNLEPLAQGRTAERDSQRRLEGLLAGQPAVLADAAAVETAADTWRSGYADPVVAGRAPDVAAADDAGKALFDQVRARQAVLDRRLGALGARARHDATTRLRLLVVVLALVAVALLVLLALTARAVRRWVTEPLRRVAEDARQVAAGDLDHVVTPTGPPDVAALADDTDAMRRRLVALLAEAETAREAVERQAEDLARSNRDLEQFAYVASHDLQEPLRKVASFCQLLQRRYGGQLDDRADTYIAFAVDGAKRMQQLINDLLAFSRVGRTTEGFSDVPLEEALSRATAALSGALEETGAVVEHDPLPVVRGDVGLLGQLLQNLVGNAVKFRGEAPPRVRVTAAARHDGLVEVAVRDNGIGVPAEYAEKVFVIFQRLHAREDYPGTGIGLALCRKIVEFHGGALWLDTEAPGPGATFRFTLHPAEPAAPEGEQGAGAADPAAYPAADPDDPARSPALTGAP